MIPLLAAVLIQAKPLHLASNLHYIELYQQTLSPCDPLWYEMIKNKIKIKLLDVKVPKIYTNYVLLFFNSTSFETFQKTLSHVLSTKVEDEEEFKPVRIGRGMSKEIKLEELSQLTYYLSKHSTENDGNESPGSLTPLDCKLHELAGNIEKSMGDND